MENQGSVFNRWVLVSAVIGLITFLFYAFYSASFVDIFFVIRGINLPLYLTAFLFVTLDIVCTSLGWRSLLLRVGVKIKVRRAFVLTLVGFFVDAMIPSGWSGDLFKAYILTKDGNISGGNTGASAVVQRMIIMSIGLSSLIVGMVMLVLTYHLQINMLLPIVIVASLFAVSIIVAILIVIKPRAVRGMVRFSSRVTSFVRRRPWDAKRFESSWGATLDTFQGGLKALTAKRKSLVRPVTLFILAWACEILALLAVFNSVGYSIALDKVIIVYSIGSALESQTAAFASFAQLVTSTLYITLKIDRPVTIAAVLLAGWSGFWFKLVISYIAFSYVMRRRSTKQIQQEQQEATLSQQTRGYV